VFFRASEDPLHAPTVLVRFAARCRTDVPSKADSGFSKLVAISRRAQGGLPAGNRDEVEWLIHLDYQEEGRMARFKRQSTIAEWKPSLN
jgi:hypothetical protein